MPGVATTSTAAMEHQNLDYYRIGSRKNFGSDRGDLQLAHFEHFEICLAQESSHQTGSVPSDLWLIQAVPELKFDGYGTKYDGFELQDVPP